MYAVYTRFDALHSQDGMLKPEIVALYARQDGAKKRAETLADNRPGAAYYVAVLPEGSSPQFDSLTDRIACYCTTTPNDDVVYSYSPAQKPDDDLPF
jgi:hypothetical protein